MNNNTHFQPTNFVCMRSRSISTPNPHWTYHHYVYGHMRNHSCIIHFSGTPAIKRRVVCAQSNCVDHGKRVIFLALKVRLTVKRSITPARKRKKQHELYKCLPVLGSDLQRLWMDQAKNSVVLVIWASYATLRWMTHRFHVQEFWRIYLLVKWLQL